MPGEEGVDFADGMIGDLKPKSETTKPNTSNRDARSRTPAVAPTAPLHHIATALPHAVQQRAC